MKRKLLLITLLFLLTTSLFSQVHSEKNSQITFKEFFYKFYSEFIKVDFTYSQYINSEIGFYCISNPGSLIFLDKCSGTERGEFYSNMSLENVKLSFQKPVGNKVEGYPGFSDGFYAYPILQEDLPQGWVFTGEDQIPAKIIIPSLITDYIIYKVDIIETEELNKTLYCILVNNKWYLLAEDISDAGI